MDCLLCGCFGKKGKNIPESPLQVPTQVGLGRQGVLVSPSREITAAVNPSLCGEPAIPTAVVWRRQVTEQDKFNNHYSAFPIF